MPPFLLPQWFISVLCCLWRLSGASLTGPSTDSRLHTAAAAIEYTLELALRRSKLLALLSVFK